MKFKHFQDFLEAKKEKGLVGTDDYTGPMDTMPPKEEVKKSKIYKLPKEKKDGVVYTAAPNAEALATQATPGITPTTSSLGTKIPANMVIEVKPKKLTSEQFLTTTKDLSGEAFVQFVLEHQQVDRSLTTITDLHGNEYTPDPIQSIEYVAGLVLANPHLLQAFLHEMKRRDGMEVLMEELFEHKEFYKSLVSGIEHEDHGDKRAHGLVNHLNDSYMSLFKNFKGLDKEEFPQEEEFFFPKESTSPSLKELFGQPTTQQQGKQQGQGGGQGEVDTLKNPNRFSGDGADSTNNPWSAGKAPPNGFPSPPPLQQGSQQSSPSTKQQPPMMKMMKADNEIHYSGKSGAQTLVDHLGKYPAFRRMMKSV